MVKGGFNLARIAKSVALLLAICWYTVPASAAAAAHGTTSMHLIRNGVAAIGDLDGDHLPDVASGINTGHTSAGYSYRVDVDLSGKSTQKSFSVFSEEPNGLNIQAIDVDGDHDLDLVITSRMSLRPIGVWINDGEGEFTPGDLQQFDFAAWQTQQALQSPHSASGTVLNLERRRSEISISAKRTGLGRSDFEFHAVRASSLNYSQSSLAAAPSRAPPISII